MVGKTIEEIGINLNLDWVIKFHKDYEILNTRKQLLEFREQILKRYKKKKLLAGVDCETTGLDIHGLPASLCSKSAIVGFSISIKANQAVYIPLMHTEFANASWSDISELILPLLEIIPCTLHNGIFDYKVFYEFGIKLNIVHDSMLLLFNFFSKVSKGSKALKTFTHKIYHVDTIEFSDIFDNAKDYGLFRHVSYEVARIYACADADYARQIIIDYYKFLPPLQRNIYLDDVEKSKMFSVSEFHGKPIDMELLTEYLKLIKRNIQNITDVLFHFVGWKLTGKRNARYAFKHTSIDELADLLYFKLKYEKVDIKGKSGYTIDSKVLTRLRNIGSDDDVSPRVMRYCEEFILDKLPNYIELGPDGKYKSLIEKPKDFKRSKCKVADLILILRKQTKYYTSFVKKIYRESDKCGVYFTGISMTNAETSRIIDFIQTLAGNLKKLISVRKVAGKYLVIFDFCQIEYRVMVGLASLAYMVTRLDNSHTDFHVEVASWILNCDPSEITKAIRKAFKKINFAIPYGMSLKGMTEAIHGVGLEGDELKEAMADTEEKYNRWKETFPDIMRMLNTYRELACTPREYYAPNVDLEGEMSYVESIDGRRRPFDLKDKSKEVLSAISRMAGNYPIQEFAATYYKNVIYNLYQRLIKEGLTDIKVACGGETQTGFKFVSKVYLTTYVHDEVTLVCDTDVNYEYLCKLIYEECMLKLPGHPQYFCGINVCQDWREGKDGDYEMPIDFVRTLVASDPPKFVEPQEDWDEVAAKQVIDFCNEDFTKYAESILGDELKVNHILDFDKMIANWKDYYYKDKLTSYGYKVKNSINVKDLSDEEKDQANLLNYTIGTLLNTSYSDLVVKFKGSTGHFSSKDEVITATPEHKELEPVADMIDEDSLEDELIDLVTESDAFRVRVDLNENSKIFCQTLEEI